MKEINLNNLDIYVNTLDYGESRFKARVGRTFRYISIKKSAISSSVKVCEKADFNWDSFVGYLQVSNNARIDRAVVENIEQLDEAQRLLNRYQL